MKSEKVIGTKYWGPTAVGSQPLIIAGSWSPLWIDTRMSGHAFEIPI